MAETPPDFILMGQQKAATRWLYDQLRNASVDLHRANDTMQFMNDLDQLAREFDTTMLIVRHLRKSHSNDALYRGLGSIGPASHRAPHQSHDHASLAVSSRHGSPPFPKEQRTTALFALFGNPSGNRKNLNLL